MSRTIEMQPTHPSVSVESPENRGAGNGIRLGLGGFLFLVCLLGYIHLVLGNEAAWWIKLVLTVLIGFFALVLLSYVARAFTTAASRARVNREWILQEKERTAAVQLERMAAEAELAKARAEAEEATARARKAELEAQYTTIVAKHDEQIFVRDDNPQSVWRPLHLIVNHRINGVNKPPTPYEIMVWEQWHGKRSNSASLKPGGLTPLLTTGVQQLPQRIDLRDILPMGGTGTLRNIYLGVRVDDHLGQLRPVCAPMSRLVHVAIGGATDSGKSMLGRVIAYQVVTAKEDVRCVFSDVKHTTFKVFNNIDSDRLLYPIIYSDVEFIAVMKELREEAERRKHLFDPYPAVETLIDYNKIAAEPLPYIVIFIDEISNMFMNQAVRDIALELVREARAWGMYIVGLGQSWSYKEMETSFRQQFRTGIHFGTRDTSSSRMLLNSPAAAEIRIQGRAYVAMPFSVDQKVLEIQAPYLDLNTTIELLQDVFPGQDKSGPEKLMMPLVVDGAALPVEEAGTAVTAEVTDKGAKVIEYYDLGLRGKDLLETAYGPGCTGGRYYQLANKVLLANGRGPAKE